MKLRPWRRLQQEKITSLSSENEWTTSTRKSHIQIASDRMKERSHIRAVKDTTLSVTVFGSTIPRENEFYVLRCKGAGKDRTWSLRRSTTESGRFRMESRKLCISIAWLHTKATRKNYKRWKRSRINYSLRGSRKPTEGLELQEKTLWQKSIYENSLIHCESVRKLL